MWHRQRFVFLHTPTHVFVRHLFTRDFALLLMLGMAVSACRQTPLVDEAAVQGATASPLLPPQQNALQVAPGQVFALVGRNFGPVPTDNQILSLRTDISEAREHIQIRAVRVSPGRDSLYLYLPAEMPAGSYDLFLTVRGQTLSHYGMQQQPIRIAVVRNTGI